MVNQLIDVMNEQVERHKELHGLSLEEKDAIIKNDIETLQKLVNLKNMVISQNNRLEKQRISLVADIAEVLGLKGQELDLAALVDLLDGQVEQAGLREVGKRLKEIVTELKEVNDINKELLETAIDFVEYSLNALRSTLMPEPAEYPLKGQSGDDGKGTFNATR